MLVLGYQIFTVHFLCVWLCVCVSLSSYSLCCSGRKHTKLICKKDTMTTMVKNNRKGISECWVEGEEGLVELKERVTYMSGRVAEVTASTKA